MTGHRLADDSNPRSRALAIERFQQFLRANRLKFTPEREEVLDRFFRLEDHIEADELLVRMRRAGSRVSRATIYRTLDLLVQAELARKVRLGTEHYYFEHVLGRRQHEHMICLECGDVIEWFDPELDRVLEQNLAKHDFAATRYSLQVFGRCGGCAAAGGQDLNSQAGR